MSQVKVLKCDHCRSVVFAVGTLSLQNGRAKKGIASLDLCAQHMTAVKRIFKPGPVDSIRLRAKPQRSYVEVVAQLDAYARKQSKPFALKDAQQALGLPDGSYSTLARAMVELRKNRVVEKQNEGRHTVYRVAPRRGRRITKRISKPAPKEKPAHAAGA